MWLYFKHHLIEYVNVLTTAVHGKEAMFHLLWGVLKEKHIFFLEARKGCQTKVTWKKKKRQRNLSLKAPLIRASSNILIYWSFKLLSSTVGNSAISFHSFFFATPPHFTLMHYNHHIYMNAHIKQQTLHGDYFWNKSRVSVTKHVSHLYLNC